MPRKNGHNRKRYVITCTRCKQQFRSAYPTTKYHPVCKQMEYEDRRKAGIKLQWKPDSWQRQNKVRFKHKRPDGRTRLIVAYPVGGPNAQLNADGKFEYRTTDGKHIYWTPEQVRRPIPTPPPKPPAPAQPVQPVKVPAWQPTQQQYSQCKLVDLDGKPEYIYPVLNDRGQQMFYNNALVWQDSNGRKLTYRDDDEITPARQKSPKKGFLRGLLG